jgi:hypothetical protein
MLLSKKVGECPLFLFGLHFLKVPPKESVAGDTEQVGNTGWI